MVTSWRSRSSSVLVSSKAATIEATPPPRIATFCLSGTANLLHSAPATSSRMGLCSAEMSDDVELVRWLTAAYNRGDLDTLRAHYAPDIVVDAGDLWPAGPVQGVDRVLAEFASIFSTFEK